MALADVEGWGFDFLASPSPVLPSPLGLRSGPIAESRGGGRKGGLGLGRQRSRHSTAPEWHRGSFDGQPGVW